MKMIRVESSDGDEVDSKTTRLGRVCSIRNLIKNSRTFSASLLQPTHSSI